MNVTRVTTVKRGFRHHAWAYVTHPELPDRTFLGEAKHRDRQRAIDNAATQARVEAGAAARKARRNRG